MTQGSQSGPKERRVSAIRRPFSWLSEGLGWRVQGFLQKARSSKTALEVAVRQAIGFSESETKLIGDSKTYWNDLPDRSLKQNSHWRGVGIFADDSRWLALGRHHLQFCDEFARAVDLKHSLKRIVEWGYR